MSEKHIKITVTFTYKPNPEYYPNATTIEEMAKADADQFNDDHMLLLEGMEGHEITVTGEVVDVDG